jgi:predicted outer membrane lipoprotein
LQNRSADSFVREWMRRVRLRTWLSALITTLLASFAGFVLQPALTAEFGWILPFDGILLTAFFGMVNAAQENQFDPYENQR